MLVATLAQRLGIEALAGRLVRPRRDRPGAANAGRKVMAVLFAIVLGRTAPMTARSCARAVRAGYGWLDLCTLDARHVLRAFTFGHVRQLVRYSRHSCAWKAGAAAADERLVIDVDSFVGEVCGRLNQGAAYVYPKLLGYPEKPLSIG